MATNECGTFLDSLLIARTYISVELPLAFEDSVG